MQDRLFINKLASVSKDKTVEIEFKRGLNIISGASDTGKSYMIECIDYLFGSETPPKDIKESSNYEFLLLELEFSKQKIFTIKRFLRGENNNQIFLYECSIGELNGFKPIELGINAKSSNSISSYIANLMNYDDKKVLLKAKTKKTKQVTLRSITNFVIVDEKNIISEQSPVFIDNYEQTYKKSLFKFLLTGVDDSDVTEIEDPKIAKAKLLAQMDVYRNLISKASVDIDELGDNFDAEELIVKINALEAQYEYNTILLNKKTDQRACLVKKLEELNDSKIESSRLINKYNLLKEYYESDTERLNFLEEGSFYLNQLQDVSCPICKCTIENSNEDYNNVINSCREEYKKLNAKIIDLNETISGEKCNIDGKEEEIKKTSVDLFNITREIDEELKPYASVLKKRIDDILQLQKKVELKLKLRNDISLYSSNLQNCQNLLDNYKVSNYSNTISDNFYTEFSDEVASLLSEWHYKENCNVIFDTKAFDIEIDGQPRGHQGKGHRALTRTAFILGLQNYMYNKDFQYPAFVILDSPLLSLKEADDENQSVSDTIQNSFWENLSFTSDDRQIIIFENKEPNNLIKAKSNFIKFTGCKGKDRLGFYE